MWWQTWIFNIVIFFFKIILIESSKEQLLIDIGLLVAYDF